MCPNDADGMANSVDPDQTATLGAVLFESTLFAQTHLSENLGTLWYILFLVLCDQPGYHEKSEINDWVRLIF